MEHGEIVGRDALPADEQPSKPVVPTVGALDDPAARPSLGAAEQWCLATSADVGHDSAAADRSFGVGIVVAFVQAQVFGTSWSARRSEHDCVEHICNHPLVVDVGSGDPHGQRNAATIREDVTFHPEFRAVRRVRPRVAPPFGALAMALSSEAKSHLMPRRLS